VDTPANDEEQKAAVERASPVAGVAIADAPEPPKPSPFDRAAAAAAVAASAASAATCGNGTRGATRVAITFAPSGRATTAVLEGASPFLGNPAGSCIAQRMRTAQVPPFEGPFVTVRSTVTIP
jgi:hypothetical protein